MLEQGSDFNQEGDQGQWYRQGAIITGREVVMSLFRFLPVAVLLAGVLPCGAQSLPQNQATQSTKITPKVQLFQGEMSPCILETAPGSAAPSPAVKNKLCDKSKEQVQTAIKRYMVEKNSTCYSIRDYQFSVPKGSEAPKLKSYSTCVPAARFEAKSVVELPRQSAEPSPSLRSGRDDNSR